MSFLWKRPFNPKIVPKADNENPLPLLWHTVIGSVHECGHHIVGMTSPLTLTRGALGLQSHQVVMPAFILPAWQLGKFQLKQDVLVIIGEGRSR